MLVYVSGTQWWDDKEEVPTWQSSPRILFQCFSEKTIYIASLSALNSRGLTRGKIQARDWQFLGISTKGDELNVVETLNDGRRRHLHQQQQLGVHMSGVSDGERFRIPCLWGGILTKSLIVGHPLLMATVEWTNREGLHHAVLPVPHTAQQGEEMLVPGLETTVELIVLHHIGTVAGSMFRGDDAYTLSSVTQLGNKTQTCVSKRALAGMPSLLDNNNLLRFKSAYYELLPTLSIWL